MKPQYAYPVLILLPSIAIAGGITLFALGAAAGALWIFVYGDNPWPDTANYILGSIALIVWLSIFLSLQWLAFRYGTSRAKHSLGVKKSHLTLLVTISLVILLSAYLKLLG